MVLGTAADAYVHAVGGFACAVQCLVNASRDEMEGRTTVHRDRRTGVMSQDENGNVIGRTVSPPAFQFMSDQGPRLGANMFRPRITAPIFLKPRAAKSSSTLP